MRVDSLLTPLAFRLPIGWDKIPTLPNSRVVLKIK